MNLLRDRYRTSLRWAIEHRRITLTLGACAPLLAAVILYSNVIGSEFLPHLDEGRSGLAARWRPAPASPKAHALWIRRA